MSEQLHLFDDLAFSEGVDVEYKAARGGLPGDLWETYSAFANTEGGTLWLGITQRDGRLDIHGVPDADKLRSDFWNLVNNRGKISANLLRESDVTVEMKDDRKVIRIRVPRADRRTRPVYVGPNPLTGTFRRNFEGDYACTEAEVRRMFADQSEDAADARILEHFGLDDLHPDSLRQFRQLFSLAKPTVTWVADDDKTLLTKLGGWRRDRATGKEGLTLAGLLMFGKIDAIRDHAALPGYNLDYRERDTDTAPRWIDRLSSDGTWEANIFQFYRQVMQKLAVGPGIKIPFHRDDDGTRRYFTPVHEALQEALVNALIHGDYTGQGGVVIDRYPDRVIFSNPGTLLVSREQLQRGAVSECRNKSLQLMFQMLGAGDKAGSGLDKIRSAWTAQHWQSPSLAETHRPDRVVLTLPLVSTLPAEVLARLESRFGKAAFAALGPDEVQTLVTAEVAGAVTNRHLQEMLTLHRVDITDMLGDLVERGFLTATGAGRGTRYLPIAADAAPPLSPEVAPGTPPVDRKLPPLTPALTAEVPPLTPALTAEVPPVDLIEDAATLAALAALAAPIRAAGRAKPELVQATLLRLCERRFLKLDTLASLTRHTSEKLRRQHLTPLVRAGRLRLRFPDKPNHPEQAYTAADLPAAKESAR